MSECDEAVFWVARVAKSERLACDVAAVHLRVESNACLRYRAGQYVRVHLDDGRRRDLSMASDCRDDNRLELWVRYAGGPFTEYVFKHLQAGDPWCLEGPLGEAGLRDELAPILVVAGGTGIAPARAITRALRRHQPRRSAMVVCGAHSRADLLAHDELCRWADERSGRTYRPVLADPDPGWSGARGTPDELIAHRCGELSGWVAHVFGPPPMVEAVVPVVQGTGIRAAAVRADAFTPGAWDLDAGGGHSRG